MIMNRAERRRTRDILLLMSGYGVILFGVVIFATHHPLPLQGATGYALGILPAFPVIGVFYVIGRYLVEEQDEYLRAQYVRQCLIATGLALSVCTAWGFLENFGLVPHVYGYYAAILWFAGLGVGACWDKLSALWRPS